MRTPGAGGYTLLAELVLPQWQRWIAALMGQSQLESLHGDRGPDRVAPRLRPGAALAGRARPRAANRPRSGRRRGPGSRPRASARGCSRCRTRTVSGPAARSSPRTSTSTVLRRHEDAGQPWTATTWTLNSLREWGLDPAVLRERARPSCSPRTAAGSTTTCRTGAARWTAASTPGRSRTARGSAPTSPASSTGSSTTDCPTAAGTASGSRARRDRRSTRR